MKHRQFEGWSSQMFWLKIIQRFEVYKKCPFKRYFPDHGGIPYTLSVKLTVSTNLSVCSAKENFLWMKSSETYYASYYIWKLDQFLTLPCTDLAIGSLRHYLGTYPASRVSFNLPRSVWKRQETLRAGSTFFDLPLIQRNGWVTPVSTC